MADDFDWLEVTLDSGSRRGLAEKLQTFDADGSGDHVLLLDRDQARVVLDVLNVDNRLSALRARLEAFLADV
jgi:hypothetical protein